jgi:hypothetical protein
MDVAGIEPGRDFRKAIDECVATCSVLLAVIGQEWLELKDTLGHRRLDDANDFVRVELASALRRDIPVIPVLVRGAKMPHADQLPGDLKELAYRNAVELSHARWKSDVKVLIQALRPYLDVPGTDAIAANGTDRKKETAGRGEEISRRQANERNPNAASVTMTVEAQTIDRVSRKLAAYIGPVSEVLVKRAAKRCSSMEELYEMLAREIETEADRAAFLRWCRS